MKRDSEYSNEELIAIARLADGFSSPSFSIQTADFAGSARMMCMRPAQVGAHLLLLLSAWREADCGLPNDIDLLSEVSRLRDRWEAESAPVTGLWFEHNGRLYNRALLQERRRQIAAWQQRTEASAAAVKARKKSVKARKARKQKEIQETSAGDRPVEKPQEPELDLELATALVFGAWNEHPGTVTHKGLTADMSKNISYWLKAGVDTEDLLAAVKAYGDVVLSPVHYWSHRFTIEDFFRRGSIQKPSPFKKFLPGSRPLENFLTGGKPRPQNTVELEKDEFYEHK